MGNFNKIRAEVASLILKRKKNNRHLTLRPTYICDYFCY